MDEDPAAFTAQVVDAPSGARAPRAASPTWTPRGWRLVGHDFGAMTGMLAGAADGRPRSYVLLALTPRVRALDVLRLKSKRPTDEAAYRQQLALLDPIDALPALEGPTLIQLAEKDFYVPPEQIETWREALAGQGELRTYPTGHAWKAPAVRERPAGVARAGPPAAIARHAARA